MRDALARAESDMDALLAAGNELEAERDGLNAELSVLDAMVKNYVRVAGVRRNAGAPLVAEFIEHKAVVGVGHGTDMRILKRSVVFVLFQFGKVGW